MNSDGDMTEYRKRRHLSNMSDDDSAEQAQDLFAVSTSNLTFFYELCTSDAPTYKQVSSAKEALLANIQAIQNLSKQSLKKSVAQPLSSTKTTVTPTRIAGSSPVTPPNPTSNNLSSKDLRDFKIEFRRLIDLSYTFTIAELETLRKIVSNITENPDEPKFRKIASKKVNCNQKIWDCLFLLGFKEKVVDFVPKLTFSHSIQTSKEGDMMKEALYMIQEFIDIHHERERVKLDERAKFKKDQEYKQGVVEKVRLDMVERHDLKK